jgi:dihydroorotase
VGAEANLVLIDPEVEWDVDERLFRSRSVNSWLLGERLRSKVLLTIAAGRVAFG